MMSAHILRMSDADTIRFLELYQSERVLWDPTMTNYKSRDYRTAATTRIATALNIDGFSGIHVAIKFKNLRSSYSQELKKIANSQKYGIMEDDVYVPKVRWFNVMDSFLKPHVKSRETQPNIDFPEVKYHLDNKDLILKQATETSDSDSLDPLEIQQFGTNQTSTSRSMDSQNTARGEKRVYSDVTQTRSITNKKKNLQNSVGHNESNISSGMNEVEDTNKSCGGCSVLREDTFDHFGKYIASILRDLPQKRASQLQADIITMIFKPGSMPPM